MYGDIKIHRFSFFDVARSEMKVELHTAKNRMKNTQQLVFRIVAKL